MKLLVAVVLGLTASAIVPDVHAQTSTPEPRYVPKEVRIRKDGGSIRFTLRAEEQPSSDQANLQGDALRAGQIFLATKPVFVTYDRLNPLTTRAQATVKAVPNPAKDLLSSLAAALGSLPALVGLDEARNASDAVERSLGLDRVRPGDPQPPQPLSECESLVRLLSPRVTTIKNELYATNYSPEGVRRQYTAWRDAITQETSATGRGAVGIAAGVQAITTDKTAIEATLSTVRSEFQTLNRVLENPTYTNCGWHLALTAQLITTYQLRAAEIARLGAALQSLGETLKTDFGDATDWIGPAFILATDIVATNTEDAQITLQISDVLVTTDTGSLTLASAQPATATFLVRQKVDWTIEPSVGVTFGYLKRPKWGTTEVDGKTVVQEAPSERILLSPTFMVNFVPQHKPGAVPLIQFGASTTPASPALFAGAGWSIPGVSGNRLAVTVGAIAGWVKTLQKLSENDPVGGTKDIEADLGFDPIPRPGFYLNLQFKFGDKK